MPYKDKEKEKAAKKRYEEKRAARTRNFATVVYPESAPADWMERLDQYHIGKNSIDNITDIERGGATPFLWGLDRE